LAEKPQIVGLNKIDLPEAQGKLQAIRRELKQVGLDVFPISAATGEGVRELLLHAARRLDQLPSSSPVQDTMPVFRPAPDENAFEISSEKVTGRGGIVVNTFRVRGTKVERVIARTIWSQEQAAARAHRVLQAMGVTEALRAAGIQEGDMVRIGEEELEWREGV
jgi:GTPase